MTTDATQRLRLIGVVGLVLAPHLLRITAPIALLVCALLGWQALAAQQRSRLPRRWLRLLLAVLALATVYASYGRVDGLHAGIALLSLLLALKLTEARHTRDAQVVLGLCYFVLATQALFVQAIAMVVWLAVGVWLITACLIDVCHPQGALPAGVVLRRSGVLLGQAMPLAGLLFLLFPRIPGPLWGLPADSGATAASGLSDSMAPGTISRVVLSDQLAFRVRFDGPLPPPAQRYWRGPVFWAFDGERWTRGSPRHYGRRPAVLTPRGPVLEYQLTLEPQRGQWVPALDLPAPVSGINNGNLRIGIADSLRSANELDERTLFTLRSWPQARIGVHTAAPRLAYARRLPATGNPRTRALAQGWLAQGLAPAAIVEQALHRFRGLPYFYTLRPQPLPETNRIDAFLFDTMQGFCAHYAGAFTFLMRAAGIPARVVTGYLGGTVGFGGYLIVRGANAHAWSEVWLAGRGWVRVDPTAAVAPQRVESGLAAALQTTGGARFLGYGGSGLWNRALLAWDWVNAGWNRWFLAYGPQLQQRFLRALGLYDLRSTLLVLTFLASGFLLLLGIFLARQTRPRRASDPVQQAWLRLCARLARAGLARAPGEGPFDYAERVAGARPDHAAEMRRLSRRYIALRYAGRKDEALHRRFLGGVRAFRPRRTCRT